LIKESVSSLLIAAAVSAFNYSIAHQRFNQAASREKTVPRERERQKRSKDREAEILLGKTKSKPKLFCFPQTNSNTL
jgi:hypothetical protein